MKRKKLAGIQAFEEYYSELWKDQWPKLKESLTAPSEYYTLKEGLIGEYHLDIASLEPPKALDVQPGHRVLDLCAAPGGKSLQLALALKGEGTLILNDMSQKRRQRLKTVITNHLEDDFRKNIQIFGHDGSRWGMFQRESFDRVLLDAPCSSESHLLQNPQHLKDWGTGRIKGLVNRQTALICSALDSLKSGGKLVYSTCAINPHENEGIIGRLLKKRKGQAEVIPLENALGEPREWGYLMLPSRGEGGPIYYCLLKKL